MNTREIVMLSNDSNYIPVKYAVMEVTVGNTLAASYAWLKCISSGIATEADLATLKTSVESGDGAYPSLLVGTLGAYSVAALSTIKEYSAPTKYEGGRVLLG